MILARGSSWAQGSLSLIDRSDSESLMMQGSLSRQQGFAEMPRLLGHFMNAKDSKDPDDESDAFAKLRTYVVQNAKSENSCLDDGVDEQTMDNFLHKLNDFGGRKPVHLNQIDEVLNGLQSGSHGGWTSQINKVRGKLDKLTSRTPSSCPSPSEAVASGSQRFSPGAVALVDLTTEGALHGKCVKLLSVDAKRGWEVEDLFDGSKHTIAEDCLRCPSQEDVAAWLQELTFIREDAPEHLMKLHQALETLLSLLHFAEKDELRRRRLKEICASYQVKWKQSLTDKDWRQSLGWQNNFGEQLPCLCFGESRFMERRHAANRWP